MLNKELRESLNVKEAAKEIKKDIQTIVKAEGLKVKVSATSDYCYGIRVKVIGDVKEELNKQFKDICCHYAIIDSSVYYNDEYCNYGYSTEYNEEQQKELEEQQRQYEIERAERENLYNANVTIESIGSVKVVNVEDKEIIINALIPGCNKNCWKVDNDKYIEESSYLNKFLITDIVYMNEDQYNYFCFNLMNNYDFLAQKGGWAEDENGNLLHFKGVAVVCENKEILIIDPSGHDYARYTCKFVDGEQLQRELTFTTVSGDTKKAEVIESLVNTHLYKVEVRENTIINDSRFIYNDYFGFTVVTGLTMKELINEGFGINLNKIDDRIKTAESLKYFTEYLVKEQSGEVFTLFECKKSPLDNINFVERLENELKRTEGDKTPEPPKTTKKNKSVEPVKEQVKNNIINIDFSKKAVISNEWKEDPATKKQLYALYCITKIKTTDLKISKGMASELISKSKTGADIKEELKQLLTNSINNVI